MSLSVYVQKTKPTQHSVRELRALGLTPHLLACRSAQVHLFTTCSHTLREKIDDWKTSKREAQRSFSLISFSVNHVKLACTSPVSGCNEHIHLALKFGEVLV